MTESHPPGTDDTVQATPESLHPTIARRVEEAVYLTAQNAERYRVILHFFYQEYIGQRDWLSAEHVWRRVRHHVDSSYELTRCEDDLRALTGYGNLLAVQDRQRVSSLDEWHHRNQVYHITAVTIELERALERLRDSHGQRGSLDPTLIEMLVSDLAGLDRVFRDGVPAAPVKEFVARKVRRPWKEVHGRFEELRTNANQFHHALREARPEDLSDTEAFFLYKDVLVENLSGFIVELGDAVERVRDVLHRWHNEGVLARLVSLLTEYDVSFQADPTGPADPALIREHYQRQLDTLHAWFRRGGGSDVLRRTTLDSIETVARHTQRLTDPRRLGSNRRGDLERLSAAFRACDTVEQAHLLAVRTLGCAVPRHLLGARAWHLMSDARSVWEQPPAEVALAPIRRGQRRTRSARPVENLSLEQAALLEAEHSKLREEGARWDRLFGSGEIDVGDLTVDDPAVRDRLLDVLGACLASSDRLGIASDGSRIRLYPPAEGDGDGELVAPDGVLVTPRYRLRRETGRVAP